MFVVVVEGVMRERVVVVCDSSECDGVEPE